MQDVSETDQQPAPAMGRHAAGGALYIGGSQAARLALSFATTVIVARILSPDDYGVIAMLAPILAFVTLFQDFGFSTATIQAKTLSREQSTALFWVNVLASLVIAFLLVIGAQFVGLFYHDPRVASVTAAAASIVFVGGLGIQHTALLYREMQFRALAITAVASSFANAIATILFALYLKSYWALFLGTLASIIVQTLLIWMFSGWRPGQRASFHETRDLLGFGSHVAAFNLVNFFARNADNLLIGKFWGAAQLGLYDRSYRLMVAPLQLINAPLSQVMLPVLSRLHDEPDRYRKAYLFCFQVILMATAPAAAVAAAASDEIVLVLLGPSWSAGAPIFFWLALVMIYQPAASSLGLLFLSSGRSRAYAAWGIFFSAVTVASFVIGLPGGPAGVARAYFFANVAVAALLMVAATRGSSVGIADLIRSLLPLLAATGFSWMLVRSIDELFPPLSLIALSLVASYLIALATIWMVPHGRMFLPELFRLIRSGRVQS